MIDGSASAAQLEDGARSDPVSRRDSRHLTLRVTPARRMATVPNPCRTLQRVASRKLTTRPPKELLHLAPHCFIRMSANAEYLKVQILRWGVNGEHML